MKESRQITKKSFTESSYQNSFDKIISQCLISEGSECSFETRKAKGLTK